MENSIKHAFDEFKSGNITITIKKGIINSSISIFDNGKGFNLNSKNNNSLGLNIVESIIKDKLNGTLNIDSDENGTKIVFYFEN